MSRRNPEFEQEPLNDWFVDERDPRTGTIRTHGPYSRDRARMIAVAFKMTERDSRLRQWEELQYVSERLQKLVRTLQDEK